MVKIVGCCHPKARPNNYVGPQLTQKRMEDMQKAWKDMKESCTRLRGCPILDNHDASRRVGKVLDAFVDAEQQLWIVADVDEGTPMGQEVAERIRSGEYRGLSLGMMHGIDRRPGHMASQAQKGRCEENGWEEVQSVRWSNIVEVSVCPEGKYPNTVLHSHFSKDPGGSNAIDTAIAPFCLFLDTTMPADAKPERGGIFLRNLEKKSKWPCHTGTGSKGSMDNKAAYSDTTRKHRLVNNNSHAGVRNTTRPFSAVSQTFASSLFTGPGTFTAANRSQHRQQQQQQQQQASLSSPFANITTTTTTATTTTKTSTASMSNTTGASTTNPGNDATANTAATTTGTTTTATNQNSSGMVGGVPQTNAGAAASLPGQQQQQQVPQGSSRPDPLPRTPDGRFAAYRGARTHVDPLFFLIYIQDNRISSNNNNNNSSSSSSSSSPRDKKRRTRLQEMRQLPQRPTDWTRCAGSWRSCVDSSRKRTGCCLRCKRRTSRWRTRSTCLVKPPR